MVILIKWYNIKSKDLEACMDINIGDILTLKKPHPCKGNKFLVLRAGMDFKIRCISCNHEIFLKREKLEKMIKSINK